MSLPLNVLQRMVSPKLCKIHLISTYRCNSHCKSCNIWEIKPTDAEIMLELSPFEIGQIVTRNKIIWATITGGEPTIRKDLPDIAKVIVENCDLTTISSNGSYPARAWEAIHFVMSHIKGRLMFNVSLEGDKTKHNYFTGRTTAYDNAVKTLEVLSPLQNSHFKLGIEYLINHYVDGLSDIERLAKEYDANVIYTAEQAAPFYSNENLDKPLNMPRVKRSLHGDDLSNAIFLTGAKRPMSQRCVAGEYSCIIEPYGDVYPCLFNVGVKKMGNIRESDYMLDKFMFSRNGCSGCWTPCEISSTLAFRPWRLLK